MKFVVGLGLIVAVIAAVGVGVAIYSRAAKSHVELETETQCPADGPRSVTVVLVDRTDAISPITERDLRNQLAAVANGVPKYGALYLYAIDGAADGLPEPLFFRCNPGDASTVSDMSGSKRKTQRRFEDGYAEPLDAVMRDLVGAGQAPASPIMEAVQAVAVSTFGDPAAKAASKRRLIIASDFMQNSARVSFYGGAAGSQLLAPEVLDAPLKDVEVGLLFIQRPDRGGPPIDELKAVWREYFLESGVAPSQVRPVQLTGANP
jgi:hypothetical protein